MYVGKIRMLDELAYLHQLFSGQDFDAALKLVRPRPWLNDDLDAWVSRLKEPPHK
jgi:hypothetical protein